MMVWLLLQPPKAVKPLCFSLALPCALLLSDPNPFHLLVLSNFTQSSRSLSWKRGIWPPRPENRSLFLSPGRRSTAPRPPLARNYEGYFRRSNLKHTWDISNIHTLMHSADPQRPMIKRGGGERSDAQRVGGGARPFIHTSPPLVPPGSIRWPSAPEPGTSWSRVQGGGLRAYSENLIWNLQAFMQMLGQIGKRETCFSSAFLTPSVSHTQGFSSFGWAEIILGSVTLLTVFIRFFTVSIAGPFKRFRIIFFPLKIRVASNSSPILQCFGYF